MSFVDITCAASLMIPGPKPSIPVAFDVSSLPMKDKTWSYVIDGIWKSVSFGVLLSVKRRIFFIYFFSKLGNSSEFLLKISAMDEKYSLNFEASFSDFFLYNQLIW